MPRQGGDAGLHSLSTCGNEATAGPRGLVPRCASCGNAGSVQAVALRLKINLNFKGLMYKRVGSENDTNSVKNPCEALA